MCVYVCTYKYIIEQLPPVELRTLRSVYGSFAFMVFPLSCTTATIGGGGGSGDSGGGGGDGGKSEIYGSVATLKFNITFNGKPLTLMIETESRSGASVAHDGIFPPFRNCFQFFLCVCVCVVLRNRLQRTLKYSIYMFILFFDKL